MRLLLSLLLLVFAQAASGNEYYDHTTYPTTGSAGSSAALRAELDLIEAGFAKLPTLTGNGGKVVVVNAGGTALEASTLTTLTNGTAQASTSGTSIDFTSIPAGVKKIVVMFAGVSHNGAGNNSLQIQIGDSGGIESTGYTSAADYEGTSGVSSTTGFIVFPTHGSPVAAHGSVTLTLLDAATNTWVASGALGNAAIGALVAVSGGSKSLTATLDRLRITTVAGSDAFDAGLINIQYQ